MKAIVCTKYGSPEVLQLQKLQKPVPRNNEVLIKVRATTVSSGDCRIRSFQSPLLYWIPMRIALGLRKPRKPILGTELSGEVIAVGSDVQRFQVGDQIFAFTGMGLGAHAEYICLPEDGLLATKPTNATFEEAASVLFGGTAALYFLRKAKIQRGQKVLIFGASGSVGTSGVQLAKYFGAEVIGVCSTANVEMVKALGADHIVDYTKEDFTKSQERYDVIFDAVGKSEKVACKKVMKAKGTYVTVEGSGMARVRLEDVLTLKQLIESGQFKAVIDRCYSLEQMREAHTYVEKGHKKGNVVITVK
ncbi:alcohol dehydrogenase [Brevibacillus reuszeri]|uniref:Alcohol dehydrogenase n=1 Tax=Brevibacillus reuszeri TaxID=54915 RepID=A0A0K9YJD8_9BACL|nr:NAD(P)-dependent alcohol dehydrogenase [Brevibacillus reuszeri]KNB68771.1 NADPH:quinone reductase [Brevibacillus reuszeri]MED1859071.1 NAD(P)-dependent alcohol dehydrogenase [Brevibacillus reuszeri]GED69289.1 alcohol dehydrogenase [Brevibacillus reuszeri]